MDRVEITGGANSDTEARRQSTAAKIVIGREEIDRYGDSTVGEVLKRLPGVTTGGRAGRGGDIRMRGLGNGYTQILLNGERMPQGFSLDSLTPEQVERIEVMRAPTAETGARAIAGTINIVLREEVKQRLNNVHASLASERGYIDPSLSWTRSDKVDALSYNLSSTLYHRRTDDAATGLSTRSSLADGSLLRSIDSRNTSQDERSGLHLGGRLQWRLGPGETVSLMPFAMLSRGHNQSQAERVATTGALDADEFAHYQSRSDSTFAMLRWNGVWDKRLEGGDRLELKAGNSFSRYTNSSRRLSDNAAGAALPVVDGTVNNRDVFVSAGGKYSRLLENQHSLSVGGEVDSGRRRDRQLTYENGALALAEFGDEVVARTLRSALWVQDDWSFSPAWAAYAGLRWEGIDTRSDYGTSSSLANVHNRSAVWTPLLHSVWKLDDKSRDQIRLSLTRSYRSPPLQNLIARPTLSRSANGATTPDRAGNAMLKPELATGIDLAFEHYLDAGGILSAGVFHRRIRDLIRTTTELEDVSWSADPRWVARPRNIGNATSSGVELEAKFRLTEWIADAPGVNLRANVSFFASTVDSVPGPNNRLDSQPKATANLGADYRFKSLPLQIGGGINWTPSTLVQLSETQSALAGLKRATDVFMVWTFDPSLQLRISANNLLPRDALSSSTVLADTYRETSSSSARTYRNVALRLEMKL